MDVQLSLLLPDVLFVLLRLLDDPLLLPQITITDTNRSTTVITITTSDTTYVKIITIPDYCYISVLQ